MNYYVHGMKMVVIWHVVGVIATIIAVIGIWMQIPPDKLELDLIDGTFADVDIINNQRFPSRFFHVAVRNKHKRKTARHCNVFLTSLKDTNTGEEYIKQPLALKWRGYPEVSIDIFHNHYQKLDSFWVIKNQPDILRLNTFLDSNSLLPRVQVQVSLIAEYYVSSDNFKIAKGIFIIHLDKDLNKVSLSKK